MRPNGVLGAAWLLTLTASAGWAQPLAPALTAMQTAVACAPLPRFGVARPAGLQIVGAQDTMPRELLSKSDLLIINGGTGDGVQIGQRYFVRRFVGFGESWQTKPAHAIRTAGWIRIVSVNEIAAIASIEYACDGIVKGDYLDPFVAPDVPVDADRAVTTGELDFTSLGRVFFGDEERRIGGTGEFMLIDRGTDMGVTTGAHFAVFRDLRVNDLPLTAIGEATVVATGPTLALVRINEARDAVRSGDFVVPRKPRKPDTLPQ